MIPLPDLLPSLLRALYLAALLGLSLYGALSLFTLLLFWQHRREVQFRPGGPPPAPAHWPRVTVQLPIYNERYVVERLIEAAANLDYPADCLEIQVIDDSSDETTALAGRLVAAYQKQGLNVQLLHRPVRNGYKAGALAAALEQAAGEFIAIFDADFVPQPDFLRQTIPPFLEDPALGLVQARWGHLNDSRSALTRAQSLALDKHFAVEQTVRSQACLFPKFNGTAGVWRRRCIEDAGGWEADTLCEDLCLSTRAVLRGWRFRFMPHVVAPAELPGSMLAYKSQQARWAEGSTQCLLKFGGAIWRSAERPVARLYALLTMSAYATSLLLLVLLLLQLPLLLFDVSLPAAWAVLGLPGFGPPLLLVAGQQLLYPAWPRRLFYLPALLLLATGLSVAIGCAVLSALFGHRHTFVRTPKMGEGTIPTLLYRPPAGNTPLLETFLTLYAAAGVAIAVWRNEAGPLVLLLTCMLGFGYVGLTSWREMRTAG